MSLSSLSALGADLAMALDPVQFAIRAGITPDPWQRDLLRSAARQIVVNNSRQSGKSTITAVKAAHTAIYQPNALVLILAPSERQAKELLRKVKDVIGGLDGVIEPAESESVLQLEFANGSRIIALPGKEATIRGFSGVTLLIVDEASRVPDELYQAVRPMLAVSGGSLVLLSTPFGRRGFFFQEWENGGDQWQRIRVPASECPRIDPVWLEQERSSVGDWWFRQEHGCEFLATDDQLFSYEHVTQAVTDDVQPLFAVTGVWQ